MFAQLPGGEDKYQFPYGDTPVHSDVSQIGGTEDLPQMMAESVVNADETLLNGFLRMFGFATPEYEGIPKAIIYIRAIINLLL